MWESWLYKTIIAFISIQALGFVFGDFLKVWNKKDVKQIGKIRTMVNGLLVSMIPFARWVFVGLVLFIILLTPLCKEQLEKQKEGK